MAYNRENLLKKIIEIQNIVLEMQYQDDDLTLRSIYWEHIHPVYFIGYRTFNTYLDTNAKKELRELYESKNIQLSNSNEKTSFKGRLTTIHKLARSFTNGTLSVQKTEYKDGTTSQVFTIRSNHPCIVNKEEKSTKTDNYVIKNNVVIKQFKR